MVRHIMGRGIVASALALMLTATAPAATLTWDSDPSTPGQQGGNGVWDTTNLNWWDGSANVSWNNASLDTTSFPNFSSGTLTLGSDVTVGKLSAGNTFSPHYTFEPDAGGLYKITLDPPNKTGAYQVAIDAWRPLTINAPVVIAGYKQDWRGDLTVNGDVSGDQALTRNYGTLYLNGDNSFTGGFSWGANASVVAGHDNAFGTGSLNFGASTNWLYAANGDRVFANDVEDMRNTPTMRFGGPYEIAFTSTNVIGLHGGSGSQVGFVVENPKVTFDAAFDNIGLHYMNVGIIKTGAGKLVLNGDNQYGGPTTVAQGTLLVNGTTSDLESSGIGGQDDYLVQSGATLGGTGTINLDPGKTVTVEDGGILAPGLSIGTLTVNGGAVFRGELHIELDSLIPAIDLLQIDGDLDLSAVTDKLVFSGNASVAGLYPFLTYTGSLSDPGDVFDAVDFTGLMGNTILEVLYEPGQIALKLTAQQPPAEMIPEPASALALAAGLGLVLGRRRRS